MISSSEHSVAFQGELGAFSHSAARKLLGEKSLCRPQETFAQVFDVVSDGSVDYGVIPIENTLYGSVHENYDNLLRYDAIICGETTLRIGHSLLSRPGVQLSQVRRAFSHPVALEQCRRFFKEHPSIRATPYYDTAGSVKMVMRENHDDAAAIASHLTAPIYGAEILMEGIEDHQGNFTRFFLLTKQASHSGFDSTAVRQWKTSLVFATPNSPGALAHALRCFSRRDLNLTKIESRPVRETPWEYLFYLDISGATSENLVEDALADLRVVSSFLKILGSYCPTL